MAEYYEVVIRMTGKNSPKDSFSIFDSEKKQFATLEEAKAFIKERYGKHKRSKMYVDLKAGGSKHIGWVYSLGWQRDWSHNISKDNPRWLQQDWVEIRKVNSERVI